jgi:hypothetical protein
MFWFCVGGIILACLISVFCSVDFEGNDVFLKDIIFWGNICSVSGFFQKREVFVYVS